VTDGHGADVVINFAYASRWDKNIAALSPDGRVVMLSFLSGRELEKVDPGPLLFKRLRIQGTTLRARSVPYHWCRNWSCAFSHVYLINAGLIPS
jgi:NADPH:quinone reductase-like Zn-dependent oxidoreductase